jgi:hypothetical protein
MLGTVGDCANEGVTARVRLRRMRRVNLMICVLQVVLVEARKAYRFRLTPTFLSCVSMTRNSQSFFKKGRSPDSSESADFSPGSTTAPAILQAKSQEAKRSALFSYRPSPPRESYEAQPFNEDRVKAGCLFNSDLISLGDAGALFFPSRNRDHSNTGGNAKAGKEIAMEAKAKGADS